MSTELIAFAARLRDLIHAHRFFRAGEVLDGQFDSLALELFTLQFHNNSVYGKICTARGLTPKTVRHWTDIPAVPTAAFKELELTSIPAGERTAVFHSSGTTGQKNSRHFHHTDSLALYETSLLKWYEPHFGFAGSLLALTPPPAQVPHSSLVHMFDCIRQQYPPGLAQFYGRLGADAAWELDLTRLLPALTAASQSLQPVTLLGTAFSFVHLLDELAAQNLRFQLPPGSRVMETGGYKNRSRTLPKTELHALIADRLGLPLTAIACEYGMSELSSQAYDSALSSGRSATAAAVQRHFQFSPWSRVQILSPETGREVAEGETGLIRIFDLANVFSVAAIQTEDLGIRRGEGFDLLGRAAAAEPRGCSLNVGEVKP